MKEIYTVLLDILNYKGCTYNTQILNTSAPKITHIILKMPSRSYLFEIVYEDRLIKTVEYDGFKYKVSLEEGLELDELVNSRRTSKVLSELSHIKDCLS